MLRFGVILILYETILSQHVQPNSQVILRKIPEYHYLWFYMVDILEIFNHFYHSANYPRSINLSSNQIDQQYGNCKKNVAR